MHDTTCRVLSLVNFIANPPWPTRSIVSPFAPQFRGTNRLGVHRIVQIQEILKIGGEYLSVSGTLWTVQAENIPCFNTMHTAEAIVTSEKHQASFPRNSHLRGCQSLRYYLIHVSVGKHGCLPTEQSYKFIQQLQDRKTR
jgi:hypothetical protein